jgi:nucleotide-binding universal stress UspA family protein
MVMYTNILVPLDGSPRAERILPYVEELAMKFGSRITLLQVIEPNVTMISPYDIAPYNALEEQQRHTEAARTYISTLEGSFRSKGIDSRSVVEAGPIVVTIISVAEREGCDLIAMASHGRSGIPRVFYGSVAAGVLHRADRPLLLVRAQNGV